MLITIWVSFFGQLYDRKTQRQYRQPWQSLWLDLIGFWWNTVFYIVNFKQKSDVILFVRLRYIIGHIIYIDIFQKKVRSNITESRQIVGAICKWAKEKSKESKVREVCVYTLYSPLFKTSWAPPVIWFIDPATAMQQYYLNPIW